MGESTSDDVVEECYTNLIASLTEQKQFDFVLSCILSKNFQADLDFFVSIATYVYPTVAALWPIESLI